MVAAIGVKLLRSLFHMFQSTATDNGGCNINVTFPQLYYQPFQPTVTIVGDCNRLGLHSAQRTGANVVVVARDERALPTHSRPPRRRYGPCSVVRGVRGLKHGTIEATKDLTARQGPHRRI